MSSMKDAYLNTLRPMDGQQADPPEPKRETTPVVDKKQLSLFVRGDVSVLAAGLAAMMEDDDDDHPVVAPFDPYSGCSCGCFDHFLCRCDKPYPSGDEEIPF